MKKKKPYIKLQILSKTGLFIELECNTITEWNKLMRGLGKEYIKGTFLGKEKSY